MKNLPKVLFAYPIFWMFSLVPIFWIIMLLVLVFQPKQKNESSSIKYLIPVILFPIISIPVGILLEGNIPWSRILSSFGYSIVWMCIYKIYQGVGNSPDPRLANSLIYVVIVQGMLTLGAVFSSGMRVTFPLKTLDFLGSTGYGFSGKFLFFADWLTSVVPRSAGISGNPTWAGAVALGGLVLAYAILGRKLSGSRTLAMLAIPFSMLNIYLSQSRSVWFGAALAGIVAGYFRYRGNNKLNVAFFTLAVTVCSFTYFLLKFNSIIQFFNEVDQSRVGSRYARMDIYLATLGKLQELQIPILGYGFKPTSEGLAAAVGSHSSYLGLLFRGGVFCVLAYLLFLMSLLKKAITINASISIFAIVFVGIWSTLEDVDTGHFVLIIFLFMYKVGLLQKTEKSKFELSKNDQF